MKQKIILTLLFLGFIYLCVDVVRSYHKCVKFRVTQGDTLERAKFVCSE